MRWKMVRNYKCPNCGSSMKFDSSLQKMVCEHCQTEKTVEEIEAVYTQEQIEEEIQTQDFKRYTCPSCGAKILAEENTTATFCSFCGNPSLLEDRLKGVKTPAQIIPFQINREQAVEAYRNWCKQGVLTPKSLLSSSTIDKITGIYVPFWLYDYEASVHLEAHGTKNRIERKKDVEYIYTDHFKIIRDISDAYQKLPADASEKMNDQIMDQLEPFDYDNLKPFKMAYLSGYLAEKYDYTDKEIQDRIENRIKSYITMEANNTITGYMTTMTTGTDIKLKKKDAKYTMLPVWILHYRYGGEDHLFTMNGQTGKIIGKRPVSKKKMAAWFSSITAAVFLVLMVIGGLL